jgi:hypothetical protein
MADDPDKTRIPDLTPQQADAAAKARHDAALRMFKRRPNDPAIAEAFQQAEADYRAAHGRLVNATLTKEQIAYGENLIARKKKQS